MILDHAYHAVASRVQTLPIAPDKFVHVQAGLAIWCAAAILLRRQLRSPWPLAIVYLAEILNEIADRHYTGRWNWPDTAGDALATWFWPTALFLLLRHRKGARP